MPLPKVLVIVGATTSGKSRLALRLAQKYNGVLICADSRQIYRSMPIGTAGPSAADVRAVPHQLFGFLSPEKKYTAAQFQRAALKAIRAALRAQKLPIIVGGTGLYVRALTQGFSFTDGIPNKPPRLDFLKIGLATPRATLYKHIDQRVEQMFRRGLVKEVAAIIQDYGAGCPAMSGLGYRQLLPYFAGTQKLAQVIEQIKKETRHYAKRQETWFRKEPDLVWVKTAAQAQKLVKNFLV